MSASLVFKTTDPAALSAYANHLEMESQDVIARREFMREFDEKHGLDESGQPRSYYTMNRWDGTCYITSMEVLPREWNNPPLGYRVDKRRRKLVPRVSTPEGKEAQIRLNEISRHPHRADMQKASGMPEEARPPLDETRGTGYVYFPNYEVIDDVLYVEWSTAAVFDDVMKRLGDNSAGWTEVTRAEYAAVQHPSKG